jgi:TP901 family phage tail tape measure protein
VAFGADRTVKVTLTANVSDYLAKVSASSKATREFSREAAKSAETHRASWDKVGKGMLLTGGLIAAGLLLAVKSYANFDATLSNVQAVSGATTGQMKQLSDAALKAGADTKFSATQAAQAEAELAKVGISTSDILGGALLGSLNLAAAGNLDLARAAEISGQAMKIFNLQGRDVAHIADVLAAGANKSAADVDTLAQAMQQGGLVAAQTGLRLEDTVGVLSAFADNALMGSDAGTSLKTMLQRLTPTSDQAQAAMDALGFSAYDAQGNFVGLEELARRMQRSFGGLTVEQRNQTMATIFGSDAVRAANVLYKLGAQGVEQYTKAVNDNGAATRVAAINMNNLKGDVEQLRGSLDTLLIKSGESGNGPLRVIVQDATAAVNALASVPKPVRDVGFALGSVTAAALLMGGAVLAAVPKVQAGRVALAELGLSAGRTSTLLKGIGAAGVVLAVAAVASEIGQASARASVADVEVGKLADSLDNLARGSKNAGSLGDLFETGRGPFRDEITSSTQAVNEFAKSVQGAFGSNLADKLGRLGSFRVETVTKQIGELDGALAQMVTNGNADQAAQAYDRLMASIDAANKAGANIPVKEVAEKFTQYQAALDGARGAQDATGVSAQGLGGQINGVQVGAKDAAKAVDDLVQSLAQAGLVQLSARDAARGYQQSLADVTKSIKENGRSLDIHTQKGRNNQSALDDVAKAALTQAQSIYDSTKATKGTGPAEEAFRASLLKSREQLIKTYMQFDNNRGRAEKYADSVLNIPAVRNTRVTLTGTDAAVTAAGRIAAAIARIPGRHTTDVVVRKLGAQGAQLLTPAAGGYIRGPGTGTSDSIPAMVSNGEYVVKAAAVEKYGATFFDRLNSMRFASGGLVAAAATPSLRAQEPSRSVIVQAKSPSEKAIAAAVVKAMREDDALHPVY